MDHVRLGYPDSAVHEASAAAVARVLEAHDLEVTALPLTQALPDATLPPDVDLFACAWLPRTDAALLAGGAWQPLGVLYRPAFIWCVMGEGPRQIGDLAGWDAADRRILVPSGSAIAARAAEVMRAYGLHEAGFVLEPVCADEASAWADRPGRIVPLCRPHALLHVPGLVALDDPRGALGTPEEARLLLHRDGRGQLDPDLIDELDELTLGDKVVSAMAHAMREGGMSAEQAADAWQRGKLTPRA